MKRVFSFGGGVQSVAVMVLQATRQIEPFDHFVFANVGDKAEAPETLAYYREYAVPYAAEFGIDLVEVRREIRGKPVDLYDYTLSETGKSIPLPIVFPEKGFGNRTCTLDWKVRTVARWIKSRYKNQQIELGIGFSSDERYRQYKKPADWHDHEMKGNRGEGFKVDKRHPLGFRQKYVFPLENISRMACESIITKAGLPVPPKSACWFCPFTSRSVWIERKKQPGYETYVAFQDALNEKYQRIRETSPHRVERVAIHRGGYDLRDVPDQMSITDAWNDADEECQVGYCGL